MITAQLPNGDKIQFPDDTPDATIDRVVRQHMKDVGILQEKPASGFGRSVGLAARTGLEGAVGGLSALPTYLANLGSGILTGNYGRFHNPGADVADALGLPKPETNGEDFAHAVGTGALEMGTPAGALNTAFRTGKALAGQLPNISRFLTEAPMMQAASGAGAGAGADLAKQSDASPAAGALAGVVGGLVPVIAGHGGRLVSAAGYGVADDLRDIGRSLTEEGRQSLAGRVLNDAAGDDAARIRQMSGAQLEPIVPGSEPTLGQIAGNGGISSLEKIAESRGVSSGKFASRKAAQRDAQQQLTNRVGDSVSDRLAADQQGINSRLPEGMSANDAGQNLRDVYDQRYADRRAQVNQAYQNVDPDGRALFNLDPLIDQLNANLGVSPVERALAPARAKQFVGMLEGQQRMGQPVTWRDLQAMRSDLSDLGHQSAVSGDRKTGRVADAMKRSIDEFIDTPQNPFPVPPTNAEINAARQAARDIMAADPVNNDFGWIRNLGLDRQAAERLLSQDQVRDMSRKFPGMFRNGGKRITDLSESILSRLGEGNSAPLDEGAVMQKLEDLVNNSDMRVRSRESAIINDILKKRPMAEGLTDDQVAQLHAAQAERRRLGEDFEQGANAALSRSGEKLYGGKVDASAIPGLYFRKGPQGAEAMEAYTRAFGDDPMAGGSLSGYASQAARDAVTDSAGNFRPDASAKFRRQYEAALQYFPDLTDNLQLLENAGRGLGERQAAFKNILRKTGDNYRLRNGINLESPDLNPWDNTNGALSPEEWDALRNVQADQNRMALNERLGATSGSPTARNLYGQAQLGNGITPALDRVPLLGPALDRMLGELNMGVADQVENGLLSPSYGVSLMRNAAPARHKVPAAGDAAGRLGRDSARATLGGGLLGYLYNDRKKKEKK